MPQVGATLSKGYKPKWSVSQSPTPALYRYNQRDVTKTLTPSPSPGRQNLARPTLLSSIEHATPDTLRLNHFPDPTHGSWTFLQKPRPRSQSKRIWGRHAMDGGHNQGPNAHHGSWALCAGKNTFCMVCQSVSSTANYFWLIAVSISAVMSPLFDGAIRPNMDIRIPVVGKTAAGIPTCSLVCILAVKQETGNQKVSSTMIVSEKQQKLLGTFSVFNTTYGPYDRCKAVKITKCWNRLLCMIFFFNKARVIIEIPYQ